MERLLKQFFPQGRFRFQVPLRHYIADFVRHRLKVVVEHDGRQHSPKADDGRTAKIEAEGYRVIPFWNNAVPGNGDGWVILTEFLRHAHPHPATTRRHAAKSPHPSPIEGDEG